MIPSDAIVSRTSLLFFQLGETIYLDCFRGNVTETFANIIKGRASVIELQNISDLNESHRFWSKRVKYVIF